MYGKLDEVDLIGIAFDHQPAMYYNSNDSGRARCETCRMEHPCTVAKLLQHIEESKS